MRTDKEVNADIAYHEEQIEALKEEFKQLKKVDILNLNEKNGHWKKSINETMESVTNNKDYTFVFANHRYMFYSFLNGNLLYRVEQ